MWVPFFHKNLDYLETLGYHHGDFFSAGGVVQQGMVTVHPVGLPHGPKPASLKAFLDGKRPEQFDEVGIMADFTNPARDLGVRPAGSRAPTTWGPGAAMPPRRAPAGAPRAWTRCARSARSCADARDELRPPMGDEGAAS